MEGARKNHVEWETKETEKMFRWLESPPIKPYVETLIKEWNDRRLLGVDLADTLLGLATASASRSDTKLTNVNWNQLAEHYALTIGVDEKELTRRRIEAGGEP